MSTTNDTDQELPANWEDLAEQAEPVESSDDDEVVCPRCFTPFESRGHSSEPIGHMCLNCGGPISGVALWDPISRIWGEGFGYRQITRVGSEPTLAHVIGVWVIFAPTLIFAGLSILKSSSQLLDYQIGLSMSSEIPLGGVGTVLHLLLSVLWVAVPIAIIRRVTINYQRSRQAAAEKESLV